MTGYRRRGCQRAQASAIQVSGRMRLPRHLRDLVLTGGSFTEALQRHTGQPVRVRVCAERRRWDGVGLPDCDVHSAGMHWSRKVALESGRFQVHAETRLWTGGNADLLRAMRRLGDTPLIRLLRDRVDCRRQYLKIRVRGDTISRTSLYRIGRAWVCVTETFGTQQKP